MVKLVIVTLLSIAATAWGFSGGAPLAVCEDMAPKHPAPPQKTRIPYKVSLEKDEIKPNGELKITIAGKSFKGFLLQVRDGEKAVGSFDIQADDKYFKSLNCHGNTASAATHKNSVDKKSVSLVWTAPSKPGKYTVYVTVAQDGGTYWVAKPSGVINVV